MASRNAGNLTNIEQVQVDVNQYRLWTIATQNAENVYQVSSCGHDIPGHGPIRCGLSAFEVPNMLVNRAAASW